MPIFVLNEEILFPPVNLAIREGILAVGGDLSPERLLKAYSEGIFPWYSEDEPIVWWSPDPRFVLLPEGIKVSRTMRQVISRNIFTITFDRAFREVITSCSTIDRAHQYGTWITDEMREAYCRLHDMGYAHSVEAWHGGELAGGLYGLSLGRCFFGESMFAKKSNASKAAFIVLVKKLQELGFIIVDAQVYTRHLESLGAFEMPRDEYIAVLRKGLQFETIQGSWSGLLGGNTDGSDGIN
ncbi:MAG TPA: leucyl/phenylalanyl-tRNA--protein transferase [Spirochaetota bacterium]|nr:leucyl/phenylalanyl-tRNA--protein transferase [Spirochaetota bacterium]